MARRPNFFIVGAPKCGTSALASWLSEHPRVWMPRLKEPGFFATDLRYRAIRSEKRYLRLFSGADPLRHARIGEASTTYLFSKAAVGEIERWQPGSLYIVMIRNPVDMAYALFWQHRFVGWEPEMRFEAAWEQALAEGGRRKVRCDEPRLLDYPAVCAVGQQIERLLDRVPRSRVHFVLLDDLRRDPREAYLRVLDFLGLPDDGRRTFPVVNSAREPRSLLAARLLGKTGQLWARLGLGYAPPVWHAGRWLRQGLNARIAPRPPLPGQLRARLARHFGSEVQRLEQILGKDLRAWRA